MKYPDKFIVKSKNYKWNVEKNKGGTFDFTEEEIGYVGSCAAQQLDDYRANGLYEFIFPEPEMVFPFTFKCKVLATQVDGGGTYTAYQGSTESRVRITHTDGHDEDDQYTKTAVKEYIKDGDWIVTSVGEPELSNAEGGYNPPANKADAINKLTIQINSDGVDLATERFNKLAQAVATVNTNLAGMQQLLFEIGGHKDEVIYEPVHDYDSFNIEKFFKDQ